MVLVLWAIQNHCGLLIIIIYNMIISIDVNEKIFYCVGNNCDLYVVTHLYVIWLDFRMIGQKMICL